MEAAPACSSPSFSTELLSQTTVQDTFLHLVMEIQMCMHVCACRSGPHRLCPYHLVLLCHHCQHNCLCSTHMGQVGKPLRIISQKKTKSVLFLRPVCFSVCSRQQKNPNTWCWHCWPVEERRGEGAEGDGSWVDGSAQHQEPFQPIVILFVSQCLYL